MYSLCLMVLWKLAKIYNFDRISPGGWSGNETIWRMTLDLNHFLYFNNIVPCKIITIVDGVIGGEGEGPLTPMPKPVGLLIGGENPAYVDAVIAKLMGYNVARIPTVYQAIYNRRSKFAEQPLESFEVNCIFSPEVVGSIPFCKLPNLGFIKPKYWKRSESFIR
jgi:hypothetical protein